MTEFDEFPGAPLPGPIPASQPEDPKPEAKNAKIIAALVAAQAEMIPPEMNRTVEVETKSGKKYTFDYADLSAITECIRGPLTRHGIGWTHLIAPTQRGLTLTTRLMHVSGEILESYWPLPNTSDPKDLGGSITYGKRYCLSAMTGTVADADLDDPKANVQDFKPKEPKQPGPAPGSSPVKPKDQGPPPVAPRQGPSAAMITRLWTIAGAEKWSNEQVHLYIKARWNLDSTKALQDNQYGELVEAIMPTKSYEQACVGLVGVTGGQR